MGESLASCSEVEFTDLSSFAKRYRWLIRQERNQGAEDARKGERHDPEGWTPFTPRASGVEARREMAGAGDAIEPGEEAKSARRAHYVTVSFLCHGGCRWRPLPEAIPTKNPEPSLLEQRPTS